MDYINCFKKIRERYCPCDPDNPCINTLFIGESPPEPKKNKVKCESVRFFYNKNTALFRHTKEAFFTAFPNKQWKTDEEFLGFFKQEGYYLIDLCDKPVNKKPKPDRKAYRKKGEIKLEDRIRRHRPKKIVVVMKGIKENVDSVIAKIPSEPDLPSD